MPKIKKQRVLSCKQQMPTLMKQKWNLVRRSGSPGRQKQAQRLSSQEHHLKSHSRIGQYVPVPGTQMPQPVLLLKAAILHRAREHNDHPSQKGPHFYHCEWIVECLVGSAWALYPSPNHKRAWEGDYLFFAPVEGLMLGFMKYRIP